MHRFRQIALGNGIFSMIVSFVRQIIVLVPVAYLFGRFGSDVWQVWLAFPIAECASVALCIAMFIYLYKKHIKPLDSLKAKMNNE